MAFGFGFSFPHASGGGFSPSALFTQGEQGAWYDPSDLTTLYQDSSGTTPVTAVEQPVGLMLDKSKGLVLGSNVVANGTFDTDTAWTKGTSWTISDGTANAGGTGSSLTQSVSVVSNTLYKITFTVVSLSLGNVRVQFQGGTAVVGSVRAAAGTFTEYLNSGNNTTLAFVSGGTTPDAKIDNVSVQALPGNHAYQTASTSRPTLRARYNLLTYSEQFDNAAWTKTQCAVTQNATTSPDGTNSAEKLVNDNTTSGNINVVPLLIANTAYTLVCHFKKSEWGWVVLEIRGETTDSKYTWFNLNNGTIGTVSSQTTATIADVGNGWYRCAITRTTGATTSSPRARFYATNADNTFSTGDGTSGIFIWGADLRVANDGVGIPAYQRIAAATDYDTSGFPVYLDFCESFGGTNSDNSMLTNSVDFSGTDKVAVFAGVRKLSDAATGILAELSPEVGVNAGSFYVTAPETTGASGNFTFRSRRTGGATATSGTMLAPTSRVLTGYGDISGDVSLLRVDGVQTGINTADQGTGNYGNYPLYIGRRNNATLPFSGRLYSLVIRGAATSDALIASTEAWVNGKTKAY